jgi:ribonuclease HII
MVDLLAYERGLVARGEVVVGIDEVGRGALAGPLLVGAVVVVTDDAPPVGLNDSKLLTPRRRRLLVEPLQEWSHDWSLGSVSSVEIDRWGLRFALALAATRALQGLRVTPTHALIDGPINLLRAPVVGVGESQELLRYGELPVTPIVHGDRRSAVIAAAAVIAKVTRDALMVKLDEDYGEYGWANNKGYGTAQHLAAIRRSGVSAHHRTTWNLPVAQSGDTFPLDIVTR